MDEEEDIPCIKVVHVENFFQNIRADRGIAEEAWFVQFNHCVEPLILYRGTEGNP